MPTGSLLCPRTSQTLEWVGPVVANLSFRRVDPEVWGISVLKAILKQQGPGVNGLNASPCSSLRTSLRTIAWEPAPLTHIQGGDGKQGWQVPVLLSPLDSWTHLLYLLVTVSYTDHQFNAHTSSQKRILQLHRVPSPNYYLNWAITAFRLSAPDRIRWNYPLVTSPPSHGFCHKMSGEVT